MPSSTTKLQLSIPLGSEDNDTPAAISALATRLDDVPGIESFTTTNRDALASAQKWTGRVIFNTTVGKLQMYTGSAWVGITLDTELATTNTNVTNLTTAVAAIPHGIVAMNTATRDALTGGDLYDGRVIFNTTVRQFQYYSVPETKWKSLTDSGMAAFMLAAL